jgi:HK97 family phage major capsid protein
LAEKTLTKEQAEKLAKNFFDAQQIKEEEKEKGAKSTGDLDPIAYDKFAKVVAEQVILLQGKDEKEEQIKEKKNSEFKVDGNDSVLTDYSKIPDDTSIDINTLHGKLKMFDHEIDTFFSAKEAGLIKSWKAMNDRALLTAHALAVAKKEHYKAILPTLNCYKSMQNRWNRDSDLRKAISTGGAASGAEWVPTEMSSNILELVQMALDVAPSFNQVAMPSDPFTQPVQAGFGDSFLITEVATDDPAGDGSEKVPAATLPTGNFNYASVGMGSRVRVSYNATEDTIAASIPTIQRMLVDGIARGIDNSIMNGDSAVTHMDTDVTAANDVRKAYDGIRKMALNVAGGTVAGGGAEIDLAGVKSLNKALGQYSAIDPNKLAYYPGPKVYIDMAFNTDLQTWATNTFGADRAVIRTGTLPNLHRAAVIPTQFGREDLAADGMFDGVTTDLATLPLVFREAFSMGIRRSLLLESSRDIEHQQTVLVGSIRVDFKSHWDTTNAAFPFLATIINLTTA